MEKQLQDRIKSVRLAAHLLSALDVFDEVFVQNQVGNEDYTLSDDQLIEFDEMTTSIRNQLVTFINKLIG